MEYVTLGKTGLKISRLGFGGIPIQRIDAEGTRKLMYQLKDAGVNYIDTARGYTVSEELIGAAIEGHRDEFVLATKSMARDKASMAKDIEISLKNLRTDHIDLYQIHNCPPNQLEQVCSLMTYLNGCLTDESDDLIDDSELYHIYVDMISEIDCVTLEEKIVKSAAEAAVKNYNEPQSGARQRICKVLQIMAHAHYASICCSIAEKMLAEIAVYDKEGFADLVEKAKAAL